MHERLGTSPGAASGLHLCPYPQRVFAPPCSWRCCCCCPPPMPRSRCRPCPQVSKKAKQMLFGFEAMT